MITKSKFPSGRLQLSFTDNLCTRCRTQSMTHTMHTHSKITVMQGNWYLSKTGGTQGNKEELDFATGVLRIPHIWRETHCQRHVVYCLEKWPLLRTEDFVAIKTRTMCMSRVQNPVVNLLLVAHDARSRHLHSLLVLDMTETKRTTNTEEKGKHQCFRRCSNCKIGLAKMFNLTFKAQRNPSTQSFKSAMEVEYDKETEAEVMNLSITPQT